MCLSAIIAIYLIKFMKIKQLLLKWTHVKNKNHKSKSAKFIILKDFFNLVLPTCLIREKSLL